MNIIIGSVIFNLWILIFINFLPCICPSDLCLCFFSFCDVLLLLCPPIAYICIQTYTYIDINFLFSQNKSPIRCHFSPLALVGSVSLGLALISYNDCSSRCCALVFGPQLLFCCCHCFQLKICFIVCIAINSIVYAHISALCYGCSLGLFYPCVISVPHYEFSILLYWIFHRLLWYS